MDEDPTILAIEHVNWLIETGVGKAKAFEMIGRKAPGGSTWVHVVAAYAIEANRVQSRLRKIREEEFLLGSAASG